MNRVAAIQMNSSDQVDKNLMDAAVLIAEAARQGAQLVVLPEMFAIMGRTAQDKLFVKEADGNGVTQNFLAEQAKQNNLWIVGGTIPLRLPYTDRVRASCLVYDNNGFLVARYDKIHLFDVIVSEREAHQESETTEPGTELVMTDSPIGKLGLAVCYDLRFPELFRYLFTKGAEVIALPAAFTATTGAVHWEILNRARAIENLSYIIAAAQTGLHASDRRTYGKSMIVDPWGKVLACLERDEPGVICADIDLEYLHKLRQTMPLASHQKIFFDISGL